MYRLYRASIVPYVPQNAIWSVLNIATQTIALLICKEKKIYEFMIKQNGTNTPHTE